MKLSEIRAAHAAALEDALAAAVRAALESTDWRVAPAARMLGERSPTAIMRIVQRHPDLARELATRGHGRGAPKSRGKPAA